MEDIVYDIKLDLPLNSTSVHEMSEEELNSVLTSPTSLFPHISADNSDPERFPLAEVLIAILVSYFIVIILVLVLRSYIARRGLTAECCGISEDNGTYFDGSDCNCNSCCYPLKNHCCENIDTSSASKFCFIPKFSCGDCCSCCLKRGQKHEVKNDNKRYLIILTID